MRSPNVGEDHAVGSCPTTYLSVIMSSSRIVLDHVLVLVWVPTDHL